MFEAAQAAVAYDAMITAAVKADRERAAALVESGEAEPEHAMAMVDAVYGSTAAEFEPIAAPEVQWFNPSTGLPTLGNVPGAPDIAGHNWGE